MLPGLAGLLQGGQDLLTADSRLVDALGSYEDLPRRRPDYNFSFVSPVLNKPLM
jgi:hypothetical protein